MLDEAKEVLHINILKSATNMMHLYLISIRAEYKVVLPKSVMIYIMVSSG